MCTEEIKYIINFKGYTNVGDETRLIYSRKELFTLNRLLIQSCPVPGM